MTWNVQSATFTKYSNLNEGKRIRRRKVMACRHVARGSGPREIFLIVRRDTREVDRTPKDRHAAGSGLS